MTAIRSRTGLRAASAWLLLLTTYPAALGCGGSDDEGEPWPEHPRVGACFFSEPDYRGDHACVALTDFTTDVVDATRLTSSGAPLVDRVASVMVFGRVTVTLFDEAYGQGASQTLDASAPALSPALHHAAGSFEIRDVNECEAGAAGCAAGSVCTNVLDGFTCERAEICLFDGPGQTGTSFCASTLGIPSSLPVGLDRRASSVRVRGPVAVTLHLEQGGAGRSRTITSDTELSTLAGFDDAIRSFTIEVPGVSTLRRRATCFASTRRPPPTAERVALTRVYPVTWIAPTDGVFHPSMPARIYVAEKIGTVSFADPGSAAKTVALDLSAHTYDGLDAGVLAIAFSPGFATDGALYVVYNRTCADAGGAPHNPACPGVSGFVSRIARFTSSDGGVSFDEATEEVILDSWNPVDNHTFGAIVFGQDGMLYVGSGDGGNACAMCQANGQDLTSLRGKILRLDVTSPPSEGGVTRPGCIVSTTARYCVPEDNPWSDHPSNAGEIWAYGLRNPWRISFDADGRLWAGDVGQDTYEELNLIEPGANYGWAFREGPVCFLGNPAQCADPTLRGPIAWYDHARGGSAITSGHVYRGRVEALRGAFVFADFVSHRVWALFEDGSHGQPSDPDVSTTGGRAVEQLFTTDEMIDGASVFVPTFIEDAGGDLYLVVAGDEFGFNDSLGEIYRFDPPGEAQLGDFPATLSATGCFTQNPWTDAYTVPSPELLPYDLQAPFWSDGAAKRRYVALPSGIDGRRVAASIRGEDGDIDFPNGTILIKEFLLEGRRLETRFMIRHDDGVWGGYTYRWRADQSDADLLRTAEDEPRGDLTWHYPSRAACLRCHGSAAGRALGPETRQLDRTSTYVRGRTGSELTTWSYLEMLPWLDTTTSERARFRLDEGTGTSVRDALGRHADAMIVGAPTWVSTTVRGRSVQALELDGATHVVTTVTSEGARTLAAFIRPTQSNDVPYIESVIDADVPGAYGTGFGLDDGAIKVLLDDAFWETGVPITLGQWQHVALTLDEGRATLYLDGAVTATLDYTPGEPEDAAYFIGRSRANALYFHGQVHDVRIFSRPLGPEEIALLLAGEELEQTRFSPYPALDSRDESIEARARAWLHTNCAMCHRPRGNGQGGFDLRFDIPFGASGLCDTVPQYGAAGIAPALDPRLVVAGAPERSVLIARIASTDPSWRMPPISSHVVDAEGLALLTAFVDGLSSCP